MNNKRHAELLIVRVRWALLATACVMLEGSVALPYIVAIAAAVAAFNALVWRSTQTSEMYITSGRRLANIGRVLDFVVITLTMFAPGGTSSNTYLLYIVVLVEAGFADIKPRNLIYLTAGSMAVFFSASMHQHPAALSTIGLWTKMGLISTGWVGGMYVSATRIQDATGRHREQRLNAIYETSLRLISGEDINRILTQILRTAVNEMNATAGYIMLTMPDDPEQLATEVAYSTNSDYDFPRSLRFGEGMAGYVAATGQPLLLNSTDTEGQPLASDLSLAGSTAAVIVPLLNRFANVAATKKNQEVIGCLVVQSSDRGNPFSEDDLMLGRMLASLISVASANARLYEDMSQTFLRTLETLANSLEARDEYTRGHSQRVCDLSLMIAKHMGVCEEALDEMRVGTLLHDIGKIGIPDAVLNKPGRLTEDEFNQMKRHPVIGYEICKPLGLNEGALMLIRNHHEKLDGSGYPDGIRGGELPLSVRIVCVADAFDAMSSRRPYREVMDEKLRLEQFNRFAGSQFDPVVVQTLKQLLREGKLDEMYADHWTNVERDEDVKYAA